MSENHHEPKMNSIKQFAMLSENDEPYPSLSDPHDYEPNLEFDDSELHQPPVPITADIIQEIEGNDIDSPVSDFTEVNFEEELGHCIDSGPESISYPALVSTGLSNCNYEDEISLACLTDIRLHGIVDVIGDDNLGRKIITVYACRLPPSKQIDHTRLLQYLKLTLDQYVEQDYSLVYFHYGLTSKNKPAISWLWKAYHAFDRKYKKNLKALYLVHPTSFVKIISQLFRPAISHKFGRKIIYINYLHELQQHMTLDKRSIPSQVLQHDNELLEKYKPPLTELNKAEVKKEEKSEELLPTQQFGVSLQFIIDHNDGEPIPKIVKQLIEFLDQPDILETEGLFRRSANVSVVRDLKQRINRGETISLNDAHVAAVLLKLFFRELTEPLLTYYLYDEIMQFTSWSKEERLRMVSILILENLPIPNYKLLKYLLQFLYKVMDRSDLNKMTSYNLAVVFGPNLVWPESEQMSLSAIGPINMFTNFLLQNQDSIFIV